MKNFLKKITGRKFMVSIISLITGILLILMGENDTAQTLSAACMVVLPSVVYCITEGKLDLKSLENLGNTIETIQKTLGGEENSSTDESN